jgi:3-deoxy-D-manno-octulosonic-acid transferase
MALGLPRERITLTGSIKYDPQGAEVQPAKVQKLTDILQVCGLSNRPLLLAASTHAGEERAIGEVFKGLREKHPSLGLLIVPRHFERGAQVAEELRGLGLQPLRRSALLESPSPTDVLVVDSTGELKAWQQLATLVIIGKSFLTTGGQNPAEAVMAGKPVLFGPHMENFEPLVRLLLSVGGAAQVSDMARLSEAISEFLARPELGQAQARAGKEALQRHHGAAMRTATGLLMSF